MRTLSTPRMEQDTKTSAETEFRLVLPNRAENVALVRRALGGVVDVLDLGEAPVHPHNLARRAFVDLDGVFQPAPAPRYSETTLERPDPPRRDGQDGEAILIELGYDPSEINAILKADA